MSNCVNYQAQIASIMDILSKAAVAEISKVVDDGFVLLRLEMCRKENEIESLKMKIQSLESELRRAGRLRGKAPVYNLGIKLRRVGQRGADYGEKPPFDRMPFVKDYDPHPSPATEEQVTQPTPVEDWKKPDTEPTPAGEPKELERVFGQEWSFSLRRNGEPAGVAQVDSPLHSGVTQNQSANIRKVWPEPVLIKQERLEEDLCYIDPQPTAATEEQVTQTTPAGDPEELSEQHRFELGDEELSELEFVVKAEQEEENVAQRLNQTGYEHSAGRLNNLGSEYVMYETDNEELGSEVIHRPQGQCRKRWGSLTKEVIVSQQQQPQPQFLISNPDAPDWDRCAPLAQVEMRGKTHRRAGTGEKCFSCAQCGKSFTTRQYLKIHQRNHMGERPFNCVQCGKRFMTRPCLKRHRRIHTGEKPFNCAQCGKSFYCASHLTSHQRSHTGEKPYSCAQCGKSFTTRPYLKIHRRMHTGERPFDCAQCGKSFYCKSHLTSHQRSHTGEKPYSCDECGNSYSCLKSLKLHYRVHADERELGNG